MNKISVIGRVSQEVETKDVGGRACASFSVASQNKHKDKNTNEYGTNFYRVTVWGATADIASKYLRKGHRVGVVGDLIIRPYVGNDNVQRTAVEINNADIDLIETRAESEAKLQASAVVSSVNTAAAAPAVPQSGGFTPVETDELPF